MIENNTYEIQEPIESIDKTIQMWTFDEEGEIKEGGPEPINLDVHNEEVISEYIDYCQNCGQDYRRRISSINNKLIGIYRQPCICSIQPGEKENEYKQRLRQELLKPFVEQNLVTPQGPFLEELQVLAGQNEAYELASLFLRSTNILGKSFLLSGATGRGKTQIAIAIANSAYKQGTSVIAIKATDLVDRIKRNLWDEKSKLELIRILKTVDLLIIDDIGNEKINELIQSTIFTIIDYRYGRKDTIFTSKLSPKEMNSKLGNPIASRIKASHTVSLEGSDWTIEGRRHNSISWANQPTLWD